MKRFIKIISLLACFTFLCTACEPQSQTREVVSQVEETSAIEQNEKTMPLPKNLYWGMKKKDVQKIERSDGIECKEYLFEFKDSEFLGYKARAYYYIKDDILSVVSYEIPITSFNNEEDLIPTYQKIKYEIKDIYGEPEVQDETIWSGNKYKYSEDEIILAIYNDDLKYSSMWSVGDTAVSLSLKAEDVTKTMPVIYCKFAYYPHELLPVE